MTEILSQARLGGEFPPLQVCRLQLCNKSDYGRDEARSGAMSSPKRRRTATSTEPSSPRVIIALDLDAFYVSACRKRDPSLIGIPIGIQQKALVATISYEAREAGVNKLDSIKDALVKCPDMVLVNGEDLSYFRQVSAQVWRLVREVVWNGHVEKLGMDELFCDVTQMVDQHLASFRRMKKGEVWFDLSTPSEPRPSYGFTYKAWPALPPGFLHPESAEEHLDSNHPDIYQQRMLAAAHLAYYLRQRISNEVGLTCSAGVAHSKTVAKLVGALHKPNQQTTFAPPISRPISDQQQGKDWLLSEVNAFLDPLDLRKLTGFGRVVVEKIHEHLYADTVKDTEKRRHMQVGVARKALSLEVMLTLFGDVIGPRLWSILCGRDEEPVLAAPEFPLQISIEDTYPFPSLRGESIYQQIEILSNSLLRRLEVELIKENQQPEALDSAEHEPVSLSQEIRGGNPQDAKEVVMVRDYKEAEQSEPSKARFGERKTWLRYPLKIRLSVRQGWSNRISKQAPMPVEIFDLSRSQSSRAQAIARACRGLLRSLIGGDDVVGDAMNLINIAALELSIKKPARALNTFFTNAAAHTPTVPPGALHLKNAAAIDTSFLRDLPAELQAEIAAEYGIHLDTQNESKVRNKAPTLTCTVCSEPMEIWLQHDHDVWPTGGLPETDEFRDNDDAI